MTQIIQIVATLPPAVSGVGDYAFVLGEELERCDTQTRFVVSDPPPERAYAAGAAPVQTLRERTARELTGALEGVGLDTVLLHFSGYGYARWGLCFWLLEGLKRWKRRSPRRRLITMFHELYATGAPWQRAFWTGIPQSMIARSLALLSDDVICGYALIAQRLRRWQPARPVQQLAVFSNVGELERPAPLSQRRPHAIVFGGAERRRRLYRQLTNGMAVLDRLGITTVVDIGPRMALPDSLGGVSVQAMGILSSDETSAEMSRARVGLADCPLHVVAKSGILAAYHAHGLLCVNVSRIGHLLDDVVEGRHFIGWPSLTDASFDAEAVAREGHRWYMSHNRRQAARLFAGVIGAGGDAA